MFQPCESRGSWILSRSCDNHSDLIPETVTKCMRNYHLMGVEFLYHNHRKGFQGTILNLDQDMKPPLQVSAFLRSVPDSAYRVLVVCPGETLTAWHYHLTHHANMEISLLKTGSDLDPMSQEENVAYLLDIQDVKISSGFRDVEFSTVVIDGLDLLANKLIMKNFAGTFNIGITSRNFYRLPDQKLLWKMLNWANPGCVGKLQAFYEIDRKNQLHFRDNYRTYWLRLTWGFCESFQRPELQELEQYRQTLQDWADEKSLPCAPKRGAARKKVRQLSDSSASADSSDSIMYEEEYVQLPSMEESPILNSIRKNMEIEQDPIQATSSRGNCPKFEDNSILLSIYRGDFRESERPSTSRLETMDSDTFLTNLIRGESFSNDEEEEEDDIDVFLKDTNALLKRVNK